MHDMGGMHGVGLVVEPRAGPTVHYMVVCTLCYGSFTTGGARPPGSTTFNTESDVMAR